MKHGEKMLMCMLAGLASCAAANAATSDSSDSPYQAIVERNVFGLKPPPPPPDPEANKPPPPKITLTGITTILGNKRALMKMTPPATPGAPAKEQAFTLGEGQREGDLEVLEIDEKAGTVKVNNFGTVSTLNWEDNGIKTAAAPPPGPVPGAKPGGFVPPAVGNPAMPAGGVPAFPTARPLRLPAPTGASSVSPQLQGGVTAFNTYSAVPATPVYGSSTRTLSLPGFTTGTTPTQTAAQQQQQFAVSGEAQAALLAAQQQANKGKPYPPAPPPVAQMLGENSGAANTPTQPAVHQPPRAPSLPPLLPQ